MSALHLRSYSFRDDPPPDVYYRLRNDAISRNSVSTPSLEIMHGRSIPDAKIYVTPWQFDKNEHKIAE